MQNFQNLPVFNSFLLFPFYASANQNDSPVSAASPFPTFPNFNFMIPPGFQNVGPLPLNHSNQQQNLFQIPSNCVNNQYQNLCEIATSQNINFRQSPRNANIQNNISKLPVDSARQHLS